MNTSTNTVAALLTSKIAESGKSIAELALSLGHATPTLLAEMAAGNVKLPINQANAIAEALGADPAELLEVAMSEYSPDLLEAILHTGLHVRLGVQDVLSSSDPGEEVDAEDDSEGDTSLYTYTLRLYMDKDVLDLGVSRGVQKRLELALAADGERQSCFVFEDVAGDTIAINLRRLRFVEYRIDPAAHVCIRQPASGVELAMHGNEEPVTIFAGDPNRLKAFFFDLECGPTAVPYPRLVNSDGEFMQFNAEHIDWVIAAKEQFDGADDDDDEDEDLEEDEDRGDNDERQH